jgi:hypothetical protein
LGINPATPGPKTNPVDISKTMEDIPIMRDTFDAPQTIKRKQPTRSMAIKAPPAIALTGLLPQQSQLKKTEAGPE